jgi:NAD(P) transhydrogenase subunit alpha
MAWYPFPPYFIGNMMIFVLASVLGYCLVASVKPSLHTPLMSMSNAISGIVIVGGMLQIQGKWLWGGDGWSEAPAGLTAATAALVAVDPNMVEGSMTATQVLGAIAVAISAVNIAGGFAVTFRMLEMFKKAD